MTIIQAKVLDATHIELSKPIGLARGASVCVLVTEPIDTDPERQAWLGVSMASLEAAYGESEPDYSLSMVREPNPSYGNE